VSKLLTPAIINICYQLHYSPNQLMGEPTEFYGGRNYERFIFHHMRDWHITHMDTQKQT